jgi:hypothetical protein
MPDIRWIRLSAGSLARQEHIGKPAQGRKDRSRLNRVAFDDRRFKLGRFFVKMKKDGFRDVQTADDQVFFCQKLPLSAHFGRNGRLRRNIAAPQILTQKLGDARQNIAVLKKVHKK